MMSRRVSARKFPHQVRRSEEVRGREELSEDPAHVREAGIVRLDRPEATSQDPLTRYRIRANVNWAATIAFYLVFVAGIVVLVVWPAVERQSLAYALILGALLGLVTYAANDLTNLATLEGFPLTVAVVDLLWGAVLCANVSTITYLVSARMV